MRNPFKRLIKGSTPAQPTNFDLTNFYTALGIDPNLSQEAMANATFFACVRLLSESVGKLTFHLQRRDPDGGIMTVRDNHLSQVVGFEPNRFATATTFWAEVEADRCRFGNSYVWVRGFGDGLELFHLPYNSVQPIYDNAHILADQENLWYRYTDHGKTYILSDQEILHFRTWDTTDGITGISVAQRLSSTLEGLSAGQNLTNNLWRHGASGKAVLQYTGDLSSDNVHKFIDGITNFVASGSTASDKIIPIPVGSTLTPLNTKLVDSGFTDIQNASSIQIAAAFGIKPTQIGNMSGSNGSYASASQQQLSFLTDTLLFILDIYEDELTKKLLTPQQLADGLYFKANIAAMLRADFASQIDSLSQAVNGGLMTPNEARGRLDLPTADGGDILMCNGSNIPVSLTGAQYTDQPSVNANGGETNEQD